MPVSRDDITYAVEQEYGVKIKVVLVGLRSELLRGMVEIYQQSATIYVDSDLNEAWIRYVVVKELAHVMLSNAENCTNDPTAVIEQYVQGISFTNNGAEWPQDTFSEELAWLIAVELLFPPDLRERAKQRLDTGDDTLFTLAEWLNVPELVVETALSQPFEKLRALAHSISK